jgi:hypothetical protein
MAGISWTQYPASNRVVRTHVLLAFAQGVPYDALGLDRQRFKPDCLRRFETTGRRRRAIGAELIQNQDQRSFQTAYREVRT